MIPPRKPPAFVPTLTRSLEDFDDFGHAAAPMAISVDLTLPDDEAVAVPPAPVAASAPAATRSPGSNPVSSPGIDDSQQQAAQLSMRILQRVDVILERRVREAAAAIAMEYANNMAREMQPALEKAVRDAVSEALALEVGAKGLQK